MKIFPTIKELQAHKTYYTLAVVLLIATLSKLSLAGVGLFAIHDEFRYQRAGELLQDASVHDYKSAVHRLFEAKGRPGEVLLKTVAIGLQTASAKLFGKSTYQSANAGSLFLFNFLIYLGVLYYLYRIAMLLLDHKEASLFAVLIYSTLTNSHLYLRHALPYDTSLWLLLAVLYQVLRLTASDAPNRPWTLFLNGALAFLSYLVYPGYVLLFLVVAFMLVFHKFELNRVKERAVKVLYFVAGSVACLAFFEALSRFAGTSYIERALYLSTTIKEGSFEESFRFLFTYLYEVEGITGSFLLLGFLATTLLVIRLALVQQLSRVAPFVLLFGSLTALYIAYAGAGYFFQKVVLYGRLLHQFLPFLALFLAFALHELFNKTQPKNRAFLITSALAMASFFVNLVDYRSVAYPRDVLSALVEERAQTRLRFYNEFEKNWTYVSTLTSADFERMDTTSDASSTVPLMTMVNCCFFYPVDSMENYHPFHAPKDAQRVRNERHFLNFKAYQYEGQNPSCRELLDELDFHIQVYNHGPTNGTR